MKNYIIILTNGQQYVELATSKNEAMNQLSKRESILIEDIDIVVK